MNRLTVLRRVFYILGITSLLSACNETDNLVLKSPDGKIQLTVTENDNTISYAVNKENAAMILPSKLGFILEHEDSLRYRTFLFRRDLGTTLGREPVCTQSL